MSEDRFGDFLTEYGEYLDGQRAYADLTMFRGSGDFHLRASMAVLARNLRDAAGCALAWRLRSDFERNWLRGDCRAWCPNLDGEPAPGWER